MWRYLTAARRKIKGSRTPLFYRAQPQSPRRFSVLRARARGERSETTKGELILAALPLRRSRRPAKSAPARLRSALRLPPCGLAALALRARRARPMRAEGAPALRRLPPPLRGAGWDFSPGEADPWSLPLPGSSRHTPATPLRSPAHAAAHQPNTPPNI